ncbi:type II toxin-antitoxin system RelE/ParE family toxin [Pseudomonas putida]
MRLVWRDMAGRDRSRIMEHIALRDPGAAILLDETFREKAQRAAQSPLIYKPGRVRGTREIVVRRNYIMIYRIAHDCVEIVRILHARQKWP